MTEITNYIFIGVIIGLLVVLCWQGWKLHKLRSEYRALYAKYVDRVLNVDDVFSRESKNVSEPFIFNNHKARVSNLGSSPLDYDTLKEMFKEED